MSTPVAWDSLAQTPHKRLFNVDEYYRMGEAGIFHPNEHLELIGGVIYQKYVSPDLRLFNVGEYYRMAEAGILRPDERVELIEGEIITMAPIGILHAWYVNQMTKLFITAFGDRAAVSVQNPIRIHDELEPVPDLMLFKTGKQKYPSRHPIPEDIFLIVEVSETTLRYDREVKLPLYAKAGIAEVWIVNVSSNTLEQYTRPDQSEYRQSRIYQPGETISVKSLPDIVLQTGEILMNDQESDKENDQEEE